MIFLGIDCGGTKTRAVAIDENKNVVGEGKGGPGNPNSSPIEVVEESIKTAVFQAVSRSDTEKIRAVCISAAGTLGGNSKLFEKIIEKILPNARIIVKGDYEVAYIACFNFKPGIVFIAGTGSIAYGMNEEGESVRVGGWGHLVGDEGSSYWVGREGIVKALRAYDGRENRTLLTAYVLEYFNAHTPDGIIRAIYSSKNPKTLIGGFAPYVIKAAKEGDKTAYFILKDASREIATAYRAAAERLGFKDVRGKLAITGGLYFGAKDILKPMIEDMLKETFGYRIKLKEPSMSEAQAAAIIALKGC
ncbi:BadF/BadG/BcrA/BcrD ATPase family protein [Thermococcus barophilus]|uniref:ATPase, BadF/BadG/BcrA/BcrD type (Modular protein) n=1 Tax=Thermococcus barophilus TaxID=55802 RepID=A0A0S1X9R4_THEBA|nr:BadF/BadG/BcrA/BcrD ATPase family protein [Thermococcus barophilus]ALM74484.1 ATPase, BadF/BadG/BcrA/BcrD type (modular protein) [Thermococcus barophilus]